MKVIDIIIIDSFETPMISKSGCDQTVFFFAPQSLTVELVYSDLRNQRTIDVDG